MFNKIVFLFSAVLILSLAVFLGSIDAADQVKYIRVAVVQNADDIVLKVRGRFEIRDEKTKELLASGNRLKPHQVKRTDVGLAVGMSQFNVDRIEILPDRDGTLYVNKNRVRGRVVIIADAHKKINVVNHINIEDYIKGVLYHEISHKWPIEAIKAQAVAARTYAIYSAGNRTKFDWDVSNDIYSQVYGGKDSERYRTNLGVERTEGEVLVYNNDILPAFFHADSGGHTEDASELWRIDIKPLRGVPSPYASHSPHKEWKRNLRLKDIQDKLVEKGYQIGLIKEIKIEERNRSGRIRRLLITDRAGGSIEISGKDFRLIVGPNIIRSNRYRIEMKGYFVDFYGEGWGHGVGLDQWGAMGMAKRRYDYKEILEHYYPGSSIVDYRKIMLQR